MVILDLYGLRERCRIQTETWFSQIVCSFSVYNRHLEIKMSKRHTRMGWKVDESQPPVWDHTNSLMTMWMLQIKKDKSKCMSKIPLVQVKVINNSIAVYSCARRPLMY